MTESKPTCLVTGATGFLGASLVDSLWKQGYPITCLGRQKKPPLKLLNKITRWVYCDFSSQASCKSAFKQLIETGEEYSLFHLAATVKDTKNLFEIHDRFYSDIINPIQFVNMLKEKINYICFFSSTSVYEAKGLYSANKLAAEEAFSFFARQNSKQLSILRISSVYGSAMPSKNAIPSFISCLKEGRTPQVTCNLRTKRNYVFVADVIQSAISALKNRSCGIFNIAAEEPVEIIELIEKIQDSLKVKVKINSNNIPLENNPQAYDISRSKRELGFSPRKIENGLGALL